MSKRDSDIEDDVARRMPPTRPDGMPGGSAALPEGGLPKPYRGRQGDEQRDPAAGGPSAVTPAAVVGDEVRTTPRPSDGDPA